MLPLLSRVDVIAIVEHCVFRTGSVLHGHSAMGEV